MDLSIEEIKAKLNETRSRFKSLEGKPISPLIIYSRINRETINNYLREKLNITTGRLRYVPLKDYSIELKNRFNSLSEVEKNKYITVSNETGYKYNK